VDARPERGGEIFSRLGDLAEPARTPAFKRGEGRAGDGGVLPVVKAHHALAGQTADGLVMSGLEPVPDAVQLQAPGLGVIGRRRPTGLTMAISSRAPP